MSNNVKIPIVKGSDRNYLEILRAIAESDVGKEFGLKTLKLNPVSGTDEIPVSVDDLESRDDILNLIDIGAKSFKVFTLEANTATVTIRRTENFENGQSPERHDHLSFDLRNVPKKTDEQKLKLNILIAIGQQAAEKLSINSVAEMLGGESQKQIELQQQALSRLETMHATMLRDFALEREQQNKELKRQESELVEQFEERQAQQDEAHAEKLKALEERESEFEAKRKELDDRSSTIVRRELRDKLKEVLKERSDDFSLSMASRGRRYWTLAAYVSLLVLLGVAAGTSFFRTDATTLESMGSAQYLILARGLVASIGFVVTAGFFIRWLNGWAERHADEEFRLRQLDLDIDRASWVVEMVHEWGESHKDGEIPQQLLDSLSANLFGETVKRQQPSLSPSEALAEALVKSTGSLELNVPGTTLKLDKKDLAKFADQ